MERGDDSKSNKNETYLLCFGDNIQPTKKKKKKEDCVMNTFMVNAPI